MHVQHSHIFKLLYVGNTSATLPVCLCVSFSLNPRVYLALKLIYFYILVVSQTLVQATLFICELSHCFFCLQDNSQAFRGRVFRWNDGCLHRRCKVQSNSVVTNTFVTRSRL
jgi:hypothetical protein